MKTWGSLRVGAIALAVVASVGLAAAPANAATEQELASWITASTLEKLDVATPDAELAAALEASIAEALAAGLIAPAVEELAEEAVGEPESELDAELDAEIDEALDDELEEQEGAWDEVSAQWHETFDAIHAEFAECREAAEGGADLCAHQFRYAMRVNHVETWQARHAAKLGDVAALPADEQEAALAKLERQGAHAEAQLERARIQLEKKTGVPVEDESEETTAPVEETTAPDAITEQSTSDADERDNKGHKSEKAGNNGNSNGNKGGNGHGNGKSGR